MHWDPYTNVKSPDWIKVFFWSSIIASSMIIAGTIAWHAGKSIKIASALQRHGVRTCVQLHFPPGNHKKSKTHPILKQQCSEFVQKRHEHCIQETKKSRRIHRRKREYVTCLMAGDIESASLVKPPSKKTSP